MDNTRKLERYSEHAIINYRKSDESKWISALFCSKIVGGYERGKTLGLAKDMSVSTDTVENMAHAYSLYNDLRIMSPSTAAFVRAARKQPYIYMAHFRALYDARERFDLSLEQILQLLVDIIMAEGKVSSRDVDNHARERFGKEYTWQYYAQRVNKELVKLLTHPDFPKNRKKTIKNLIEWLGKNA